jgi:hypothetical protein
MMALLANVTLLLPLAKPGSGQELTSDNERINEVCRPVLLTLYATEDADSDRLRFHAACASKMSNICSLVGPD